MTSILTAVYGYEKSRVYLRKEKVDIQEILREFRKERIFAIEYEILPLEAEGHITFEHRSTYDEDVKTFITESTVSKEDIEKIKEYRKTYLAFMETGLLLYDKLENFRDYKYRIFSCDPEKQYFIVVYKRYNSIEEIIQDKGLHCLTYEILPSQEILINSIPHEHIKFTDDGLKIVKLRELQEPPIIERMVTLDRKKKETMFQTDKGTIVVKDNTVTFRGRFSNRDVSEWTKKIENEVLEWCPTVEDVKEAYRKVFCRDVSEFFSKIIIIPRVVEKGVVLQGKVIVIPKDESKAGLLIGKKGRVSKEVSKRLDGYRVKVKTSKDELKNKLSDLMLKLLPPNGE